MPLPKSCTEIRTADRLASSSRWPPIVKTRYHTFRPNKAPLAVDFAEEISEQLTSDTRLHSPKP